MDTYSSGTVLLVGEGNFSFAVALKLKLPLLQMVATTFEKEPISSLASTNIQILKNQGVKVYLGVDGTALESNSLINEIRYSRIIFNFPHSGGKGCIKRNRTLLKNFFCSSSQLLSEDGDICVTLCCGQGGTGAEECQREWSNHWQVVSMATYGNLILKNIHKFQSSNFLGYTSGGYRNQDKEFSTENALTHIFKKGGRIDVPQDFDILGSFQSIDRRLYCIKYYSDKLQSSKTWESHPLVQNIKTNLLNTLGKHFKIKDLSERNCIPFVSSENAEVNSIPVTDKKLNCREKITENITESQIRNSAVCNIHTFQSCCGRQYVLSQSLKQYLPELLHQCKDCQDSDLILIFKTVYSSAPIHFNSLPFKYQVLGITKSSTVEMQFHIRQFLSSLEKREIKSGCIHDLIFFDTSLTAKNSTFHNLSEADNQKLIKMQQLNLEDDNTISCKINDELKKYNLYENARYSSNDDYFEIFEIDSNPLFQSGFLIDLMKLAIIQNNIKDWRYLLISQSENISQQNDKINKWNSFSLYPPIFNHDLSFWEPKHFDEVLFYNVIRTTVGDIIRDVILLERHYHEAKHDWSRLYRLTYESLDKPLSSTTCNALQLHLRVVLENVLGFVLR